MPPVTAPIAPPRGPYYVASALATAQAWAARVDAAQGYPKPGVFAAPGPFQPPTPFVTQTYSEILQHPTQQQWAYPSDAITDAALAGATALPAAAALTADWAGTQPLPVQAQAAPAAAKSRAPMFLAMGLAAAGIVAAAALTSPAPSTAPSSPDAAELDGGDGG